MCGIFGFSNSVALNDKTALVTKSFSHRGPDSNGVWKDQDIILGHTRLSILDLSPAGAQPMLSASTRYVISFNGEIYNFQHIKKSLEQKGHKFVGTSDTEVILASIEYNGIELTLDLIDGIFAFAIWDRQEKSLTLARDRFGIKPLCFGWEGKDFFFASDTRIVEHLRETQGLREIDNDAVATFLRYGYISAPLTIYKGVYKLGCASYLLLKHEELNVARTYEQLVADNSLKTYWSPPEFTNTIIPNAQAVEEVEALISQAVTSQLMSDVPLGAFLSGGMDSSVVVSQMQAINNKPILTFSIGFEEKEYDESTHAALIAKHLGTEHHQLIVSEADILSVLPLLSKACDEPFGDSSILPTMLVSKMAREHVTVSLSGDAGDELFGGYSRYSQIAIVSGYVDKFPHKLREIAARVIHLVPQTAWRSLINANPFYRPKSVSSKDTGFAAHYFASLFKQKEHSLIYDSMMSQWPRFYNHGLTESDSIRLQREQAFSNGSLAQRITAWDFVHYLPGDILTKVDRASMCFGLEARVPLLDRNLVEYVLKLAPEIRFAKLGSKNLLKQVLEKKVPRELFERPKKGFGVPVEKLVLTSLRSWAEQRIEKASYFVKERFPNLDIQQNWQAHCEDKTRWNPGLWSAMMLADWLEARGY